MHGMYIMFCLIIVKQQCWALIVLAVMCHVGLTVTLVHLFSVVRDFLSGQPFISYMESPYYLRYLQWKSLERSVFVYTVSFGFS